MNNNNIVFTSEETCSSKSGAHSDEEVILASAFPKKRAGRRVFKETRHPVYRGVRCRNKNKWVCEMRVPKKNNTRIWLGTYPTPEMAARAHDVAAISLRGKSACLNFADSAWRLTLPATTDAEDIRRAAVQAAESFATEPLQNQDVEGASVVEDFGIGDDEKAPARVSEFEELHDLLLRMANEPLRSPPPCARDGSGWNDVDVFDDEVSLWNFSV